MSFLKSVEEKYGTPSRDNETVATVHQLLTLDGATPYALAALNRECANVTTAPEGTRNHALTAAMIEPAKEGAR